MITIDLSYANKVVSYSKLRAKVDCAILRIGFRGYGRSGSLNTDAKLYTHSRGCFLNHIPVRYYFLSQAITVKEAHEEAIYCSNIISKLERINKDTTVYFDSEYSNRLHNGRADKLSAAGRTDFAITFCRTIKALGYGAGIYASKSWFANKLYVVCLLKYDIWCAQYSKSLTAKHRVDLWQYTSKGRVNGVIGYVDCNKGVQQFVPSVTNCVCSVWSEPEVAEKYRERNLPVGYNVNLASKDIIRANYYYGRAFYKTIKGKYILCKSLDLV